MIFMVHIRWNSMPICEQTLLAKDKCRAQLRGIVIGKGDFSTKVRHREPMKYHNKVNISETHISYCRI